MRALRIELVVSEADAGSVLADLSGRVHSVNYKVVEDVPWEKNKPRAKPKRKQQNQGKKINKDKTSTQVVLDTIAEHRGKAGSLEIRNALSTNKFSVAGTSSTLDRLCKQKLIRRVAGTKGKGSMYEKVGYEK